METSPLHVHFLGLAVILVLQAPLCSPVGSSQLHVLVHSQFKSFLPPTAQRHTSERLAPSQTGSFGQARAASSSESVSHCLNFHSLPIPKPPPATPFTLPSYPSRPAPASIPPPSRLHTAFIPPPHCLQRSRSDRSVLEYDVRRVDHACGRLYAGRGRAGGSTHSGAPW